VTHRFRVSPRAAARIQEELRAGLETSTPIDLERVRLVAAADVSYRRGDERMYAAVTVLDYPSMETVESRWGSSPAVFPYIPGLLTFREAPALLPVFRRLKAEPDVVMFDGHGVAHPRGIGIASHMGVLLGVPTVGVAKSVLVGEYREPGRRKGSRTNLVYRDEDVGVALRSREGVKPVFVSVGHLADLDTATRLALSCCRKYRIPEPIRAAHILSNEVRRSKE
jgi:deoxyribonuclease V